MQIDTLSYSAGQWSKPFPPAGPNTMVLVFGASAYVDDLGPFEALASRYPDAVIAGCSTAGEILDARIHDDTLTVVVARFEATNVRYVCTETGGAEGSFEAGQRLAAQLAGPQLRSVFVLSDGLNINGSALVRGLNLGLPDTVSTSGGLAGDGDRFERSWVLDGAHQPATGVVSAVGFYGDAIRVQHGSRGGWGRFGPDREITRSDGPVLYELDGKPALELYKRYLGERADELPASGLLFPLEIRANDTSESLVRTILSVDEATQSLTFAGDLPQGWTARLMKANFDRLVDGAAVAGEEACPVQNQQPVLSIAISCVGRRLILGDRAEDEVEAVLDSLGDTVTQVGFYSYGELTARGVGDCALQNQTMTLTTLHEVAP